MNNKAFLFTISVIIFASTLLLMTQLFSSYSLNYERTVLSSYKTTIVPYLNDDLAFDLMKLLDLDLDVNYFPTYITINLNSSISNNFDFSQKLSDYNSFLIDNYFPIVSGEQSINFNSDNNTLDLLFGNDYVYSYNFDSNSVEFISNSDSLLGVDLNIDLVASDLNQIIEPSPSATGVIININYTDDTNYFSASYDFDPTESNELIFVYGGDYNLVVSFGDTSSTNSIRIDSNAPGKLDFSLGLNYSFDSTTLPIRFNTVLSHSGNSIDSNSQLKVMN